MLGGGAAAPAGVLGSTRRVPGYTARSHDLEPGGGGRVLSPRSPWGSQVGGGTRAERVCGVGDGPQQRDAVGQLGGPGAAGGAQPPLCSHVTVRGPRCRAVRGHGRICRNPAAVRGEVGPGHSCDLGLRGRSSGLAPRGSGCGPENGLGALSPREQSDGHTRQSPPRPPAPRPPAPRRLRASHL